MTSDLVTALVRDLDFSKVGQATATSFFTAYPRSFGALRDFSTSDAYRSGIYKLAIPYLITAVIIIVAALIANFYFLARKSVVPGANDTRESDPGKRDCVAKAYLPFSCFLNVSIFVCIAISIASCSSMQSASGNATDVLDAARSNISLHIESTGRLLQQYAVRASEQNLDEIPVESRDVFELFADSKGKFDGFVSLSTKWFGHLDTIRDEITALSSRYIFATVITLILSVLGLLLSFVCDVTAPDSRCVKIFAFAMLLIPLAAAWAHTAISTWLAVATADFCASSDEFYMTTLDEIEGRDVSISESNIFNVYQLTCPASSGFADDLKAVNGFLGNVKGKADELSPHLDAITGGDISPGQWEESRAWMQDRVNGFQRCDTQFAVAFKLSVYVCGNHGSSGITAVAQLWLSSLALSLLFTAVVALLSFGEPPSEFCSARELMCVYGAPELISAFGDIKGVLKRHATFLKMEDGEDRSWNVSTVSSDLDAIAEVAKEYNFNDDSLMSTNRPRRNAYTSHPLKDQKIKSSEGSLSHFGGDVDDSSTDSSASQ